MIIVCVTGIVIIVLLFVCTLPYKKTFRKKLDKKQHKLLRLYGISMFILDRVPKKIIYRESSTGNLIKRLSVKEDSRRKLYLYFTEKIAICILMLIITFIAGAGIKLNEKRFGQSDIKSLKRDSTDIITYEFVAQNEEGQEETLIIDVNRKELTKEQVYKIFENIKKPLLYRVLSDNDKAEYVNKKLNLVNRFGKEKIMVTWNISDESIIDYDGKISDKVPEEGVAINLTATLTLNDISKDYTFVLQVFPPEKHQSIQAEIQKYVDENNKYDEEIELPSELSGEKIKYFDKQTEISGWIVLGGIILSVGLFFLKDKDLKKDISERKKQMLLDYPEIVSKTLLYYNAGLSVKSAFARIVSEYKRDKKENKNIFRYAYEELEVTLIKMESGVSEIAAVNDYGIRCGIHSYVKFAGIIEQNLKRGSKELSYALKEEAENAMIERKNAALKSGGQISTKLLGPMAIMLLISMAIIMVPAFMSIEF